MVSTDVAIVGAGQAGLALSRHLSARGIEHLLLERGRVAERWISGMPDRQRLLTPNWLTRLPEWPYRGPDPDGFMSSQEVAAHLGAYAGSFSAPVCEATDVLAASAPRGTFVLDATRGTVKARSMVIATGHCDVGRVPSGIEPPRDVVRIHAAQYRSPAELPPGGVLVVGASSSGVQIADEICASGRDVLLSVGRHIRVPRSYRGRDIFHWLDRIGLLSQRVTEMPDPAAAYRQPSLQLVGAPDGASLDLAALAARGVRLAGRLSDVRNGNAHFADDLAQTVARADVKLQGLLDRIDAFEGLAPGPRPTPVRIPPAPTAARLGGGAIASIIWATGYRRSFPWLHLPVVRPDGDIDQTGGVTKVPGLFTLGYRMQIRRNSSFLDGVGADAIEIARHIETFLTTSGRKAA